MRAKLRAEYISLNHILYVSHNTYNKGNEVNFIFLFLSILFVSGSWPHIILILLMNGVDRRMNVGMIAVYTTSNNTAYFMYQNLKIHYSYLGKGYEN